MSAQDAEASVEVAFDARISPDIVLRHAGSSDLAAIRQWLNDSISIKQMAHREFSEPELAEQFSLHVEGCELWFVVCQRDSGTPVGLATLNRIDRTNRHCEIGRLVIGEHAVKNRGYGTAATCLLLHYAFTALQMHKVSVSAAESNLASIKCLLNAGMRFAGHMRDAVFKNGNYISWLHFDILESEWQVGAPLKRWEPDPRTAQSR